MSYRITVLLSLACLCAGQRELAAQSTGSADQPELWQQVAARFGIPYVQVRTGAIGPGYAAQVTLEDSTAFGLTRPQRKEQALAVAQFVREHYASDPPLTVILVVWSWKYTDGTQESFMAQFPVAELDAPKVNE